MESIIIHLYKAILLALEEKNNDGIPAIDSRTGEFVFVNSVGEGDDDIEVRQIFDPSPTHVQFDLNPEMFITSIDFAENSENLQEINRRFAHLLQKVGSSPADALLNNSRGLAVSVQQSGETITDDFRTLGNSPAKGNRRLVGQGKIDRQKYSQEFSGITRSLLKEIENITDKIVRETSNENTIQNAADNYDKAVATANLQDDNTKIQTLRKIKKNLGLSSLRQDRRHEQNRRESRFFYKLRKSLRKSKKQSSKPKSQSFSFQIKKVAYTIVAIFTVGLFIHFYYNPIGKIKEEYKKVSEKVTEKTGNAVNLKDIAAIGTSVTQKKETKQTAKSQPPKSSPKPLSKTFSKTKLNSLINIYAAQKNVKVWAYSRQQIYSEIGSKKMTDWQVRKIIIDRINKIKEK